MSKILICRLALTWKIQFPHAALQAGDVRATSVPSQCFRFLHDLCSFSSLQVSTKKYCCSRSHCTFIYREPQVKCQSLPRKCAGYTLFLLLFELSFSITYILIQSFYTTISHNTIPYKVSAGVRKVIDSSLFGRFLFFSWFFISWSFRKWYIVLGNTYYPFLPLFLLQSYNQVSTLFKSNSEFVNKIFFRRRHQDIFHFNTLETISCFVTLPNNTLSQNIIELSFHMASSRNSMRKRKKNSSGVIFSQSRNLCPRCPGGTIQNFFSRQISKSRKWVIQPTPCLYTMQKPITCTNFFPIIFPYLSKLPSDFVQIQKVVDSQSDSSTEVP